MKPEIVTLHWCGGERGKIHVASPVTGDLTKFGRGDASSPAPATTLAQPQQNQTQTHHTTQQTFLNPALPPGYSYTSLPYYTGVPGLPSTFQYGPAVFPVSTWAWSFIVVKHPSPGHYSSCFQGLQEWMRRKVSTSGLFLSWGEGVGLYLGVLE